MKVIRKIITNILRVLAGTSFIVMVALTCWQVITRYLLNKPSTWSEELVSYLFAWMSLLGAALVTSEREHMNIPILSEKLGKGKDKFLLCLNEVVAFIFSAVILFYGGIQITKLTMGQLTSSLGVPLGIFYFLMPVCGVLNMIYTIMNIVDISLDKTNSTNEATEAI